MADVRRRRWIYFVSDRTASEKNIKYGGPEVMKSVNNIWKISDKGGAPVQVTHHTDGNLYFPEHFRGPQDYRLLNIFRAVETGCREAARAARFAST